MIFFLRQRRVRASSDVISTVTESTAPFAVGIAPQPMKQGRNALSDDVTLGSSTMPDSPATPMGVYVSVLISYVLVQVFLPCTSRTHMSPHCPSLKIRTLRTSPSKHFLNSTRPQEIPLPICRSRDNKGIETVLTSDFYPLGFAVKPEKASFSLFD